MDFLNRRVKKMRAFLLVLGLLRSLDSVWCESCLPRLGYVCKEIPTSYPAGMSSLVLWVSNVGEINSTVFNNTNLASVTSLTLEKSGITAIAQGAFDKFQNLKMLDLYSNALSQVTSAWFTHKEKLENLNLSRNKIAALNDNAFLGLVGLLRLNLSHNQIQSISNGTFCSLSKLSQMDLSYNGLSHMSVDTLRSVNSTKISLNGNPWNCSYTEFTVYLRELQKASLLENEMEVLCDSPACLKGVPVWNVSNCVETITAVDPTIENIHIPQSTSIKPHMDWSIITSLIVLYHRKRKQKHLRTIKPSPEDPESGKQAQPNCREALESSKNVGFLVPDLKKKQLYYRTEVVLGLDRALLDSEKVSQIYQIYGTGIHQSRASRNRAKSAGPVLSRTDVIGRQPQTEMENQKDLRVVKDKELYARWAETEKEQRKNGGDSYEELFDQTKGNSEELQESGVEDELQRMSRMEKKHLQAEKVDHGDEFKTALETQQKSKENSVAGDGEKEEYALEKNTTKKQEFLHTDDDIVCDLEEVKDGLAPSLPRCDAHQQGNDAAQFLQDSETIPYLTIGTDPENQNSEPEQIPAEASTRQEPSKPIRRVLTWPPTAAQWKKQWAQTQQVLSAFPHVIFVTGCKHHISSFPSSISSSSSKSIPQSSGSRSVPGPKSPGEDVTDFKTVEPLKKICEAAIHSYIQSFPSSAQEVNEAQSSINQNSILNSKARSDLVRGSLMSEERHSKPDNAKSVNSSEDSEKIKRSSRGKKMEQTVKSEQVVSKSERRSRKRERERRKPLRGKRDQSGSGSRAPPSGGSPSDDSLLVDNEYAFIDLLHEVVENHGRWTRERWRQSHMNKQKQKQAGKGH